MPDGVDIHSLLNNGFWSSARAKTPEPRFDAGSPTSPYSYHPRIVPRTSYTGLDSQNGIYTRRTVRELPPAPTVEDEVEALAKEHGSVVTEVADEKPQHPGEADQYPILELIHDYNPERRFVIVPTSSDVGSAGDATDTERKPRQRPVDKEEEQPVEEDEQRPVEKQGQRPAGRSEYRPIEEESERGRRAEARPSPYEANARRKYDSLAPEDTEANRKPDREEYTSRKSERDEQDRPPTRERRRSRLGDLPAIVTDLDSGRSDEGLERRFEGTPRDTPRARSNVRGERGPDDYFSPGRSSRKIPDDSMLTPDVIKHSTKGRDRAYWDYSGGSTPSAVDRHKPDQLEDPRSVPVRMRGDHVSPTMPKRHSAIDVPKLDRRKSRGAYDDDRSYLQPSPPKLDRKGSYQSHTQGEREPVRARSRSFRATRESPPRRDERYSSAYREDDYAREEDRWRGERRHRRKSTVHDERNGYLATPSEARSAISGRGSKASSPLASPLASQSDFAYGGAELASPMPSPRSSTFPINRESKKYDSTYPTNEPAPERPLSRASTSRSGMGMGASVTSLAAGAAAGALSRPGSPSERTRKSSALLSNVQSGSDTRNTSRTGSPSPSSASSKQAWSGFDPVKQGIATDQPVSSYRRYSQDVRRGELPDRPDCPRTREEAGHMDWLTLPRCNNFNICPSCYEAAFANTEFKHRFVPAPFRPRDRPLKCDFGSSEWYHIAWLLTHKYNQPDLRLFHGVASASASGQPCPGHREEYRIWYTIKDPVSQRPVRNFQACHHCAKTIEALLPNLYGVFVPMDSPAEPTRGVCDMHQDGYLGIRKRFMLYFDAMETVSDRALATSSAPDIKWLAEKVGALALRRECRYGGSEDNQKWYTMRSIPRFTVCEECYEEVVWPEIEREDAGVQANFTHKPTTMPVAACQLYSPRMRGAFQKAVRRQDLRYFEAKVLDRQAKEREIVARMTGLDRRVLGAEWCEDETRRLQREWAKWE